MENPTKSHGGAEAFCRGYLCLALDTFVLGTWMQDDLPHIHLAIHYFTVCMVDFLWRGSGGKYTLKMTQSCLKYWTLEYESNLRLECETNS